MTPSGVRLLLPTPNVSALPLVTAVPAAPMRAGTPAKTPAAILARTHAAVPVWTRGAIPGWIRGEARGWTRAPPLGRTRVASPGRTRGEALGRTHGAVLGRTHDGALSWMRGVVLGWTRAVRLAWRGGLALAGDGTRDLVVTPGRTRGVMPGWTRVPLATPARRVMPRWTRGVIHGTPVVPLEWMHAVVMGRPGGAILARGGTQAWAPVAVAIAWTRGAIQGWTRVTIAALTCAVMPGSIRAGTRVGGGVTRAVVPDRRCRVTPGWTRAGIPAVAAGRVLGLARAAIPGRGETPGLTRAGRPRGSGPGRTRLVAVVLARRPGSALVPMPCSGPGRTLSLGRGRGQTGRLILAPILGRWILVPGLAPTAHRGRVRDLTPARLSNPLRSEVPGAPARAAPTARRPL